MPIRGKDWPVAVKAKAVALWKRGRTRPAIVRELAAYIDARGIDTGGRAPTERLVRDWTDGVTRRGEPWAFDVPGDLVLIAPVLDFAWRADGPDFWPSRSEAAWFAGIRALVPTMPPVEVYETALYAADRPEAEQRANMRALVAYAADRDAIRQARQSGRQHPAADGLAIGVTAIADKDADASDVALDGLRQVPFRPTSVPQTGDKGR